MYNNSQIRRQKKWRSPPTDEAANAEILKHLANGPLNSGVIARLMRQGGEKIAQRLYRMERKGLVEQEKHRNGRWALPGTFPKQSDGKKNKVPSRMPCDFVELRRDPFAKMRLAELTRETGSFSIIRSWMPEDANA